MIYNAATLGGALVVGVIIVAQFGLWATAGYLLLLALTGVGLLATVCARCGYYGRLCALGLGKVVALVGLLLAGLSPHPRLVCGHCCQGERGVCPVGRQLWKIK